MQRLVPAALLALLLALPVTGCAGDRGSTEADPSGSTPAAKAPTETPRSPASTSPSDRPPGDRPPGGAGTPTGGTPASPASVETGTDLLAWQPVPGPVADTVTRGGPWTLRYGRRGTAATLAGPNPVTIRAGRGMLVSETLLDAEYAVVVTQDTLEQRPGVATVVELESGRRFRVDGSSEVPTTSGGTWALGQGSLMHATIGPGRAYCLAEVELAGRTSDVRWCAPKRHGFNGSQVTPAGESLMTFDDSRPSCRTVAEVSAGEITPFPGVEDCRGWEGLLLEGGTIWSVVENERRIEEASFFARVGDGYADLGPGTSGTLTWCGGSAYFVRDPQRSRDPARLLRWSGDGSLDVVYQSRGRGRAFLTEPRCGGDRITVTALSESGDEQVTARLR